MDLDIEELVQAARDTIFSAELSNVSMLQLKVYQDAKCTKICGNGEKLEDFSVGKSYTSPFYIEIASPAAGTALMLIFAIIYASYMCCDYSCLVKSLSMHLACTCCCGGAQHPQLCSGMSPGKFMCVFRVDQPCLNLNVLKLSGLLLLQ
jgi:hypothetical protein